MNWIRGHCFKNGYFWVNNKFRIYDYELKKRNIIDFKSLSENDLNNLISELSLEREKYNNIKKDYKISFDSIKMPIIKSLT